MLDSPLSSDAIDFYYRMCTVIILKFKKIRFTAKALLSTLCVHTHLAADCWKMKKCEISLAIASYAAEFVDRMTVLAGNVFTSRYLRLNKGTCRPSDLPCRLFITVTHVRALNVSAENHSKSNKASQKF